MPVAVARRGIRLADLRQRPLRTRTLPPVGLFGTQPEVHPLQTARQGRSSLLAQPTPNTTPPVQVPLLHLPNAGQSPLRTKRKNTLIRKYCNIKCQISEQFQISYFKKLSFQKHFMDNRFEQDNGRKLSLLYFSCLENAGSVKLTSKDKVVELQIQNDLLIIFKSRLIQYTIQANKAKVFVIRFWINGPT